MKEIKKLRTHTQDVLDFIFEEDNCGSPLDYYNHYTDDSMEEIEDNCTVHITCSDGEIWTNDDGTFVYYRLDDDTVGIHYMHAYESVDYTDTDEMIGDICGF